MEVQNMVCLIFMTAEKLVMHDWKGVYKYHVTT